MQHKFNLKTLLLAVAVFAVWAVWLWTLATNDGLAVEFVVPSTVAFLVLGVSVKVLLPRLGWRPGLLASLLIVAVTVFALALVRLIAIALLSR